MPSEASRRLVFLTDGTFEGLLTAVFEAYARKAEPAEIRSQKDHHPALFEECVEMPCDAYKAERVWKGLKRHLGPETRLQVFHAYLSAEPDVETLIYRYIRMVLPHTGKIADPEAPAIHLAIERLSQKVRREAHRMKGLVRFAKMENDLFLAVINPRYDVLPLVRNHFEKRYADQRWVIFDSVRNYGLFFDMQETFEVLPNSGVLSLETGVADVDDEACRQLWKTYFAAVNIAERCNPKLHLRQLPRRYWSYLPEKC